MVRSQFSIEIFYVNPMKNFETYLIVTQTRKVLPMDFLISSRLLKIFKKPWGFSKLLFKPAAENQKFSHNLWKFSKIHVSIDF